MISPKCHRRIFVFCCCCLFLVVVEASSNAAWNEPVIDAKLTQNIRLHLFSVHSRRCAIVCIYFWILHYKRSYMRRPWVCLCTIILYDRRGFPNAIVWWATLMWSIRFHTVDVAFLWLITYTSHSLVVYKNSSNRAKLHVWAMSMCFCSHRSRLPILLNFPLWHFIVKAKNRVANMRQTCHSSYGSAKCSGK